MHFSSAFLVFGIHGLNPLNGDPHHGVVSDLARQFFVGHTGYVQVGLAAVDSCVVRRRGIAKRFRKAADFRPPLQRFRRVSSRKNRDRALNDRLHDRSIPEYIRVAYIHAAATTTSMSPAVMPRGQKMAIKSITNRQRPPAAASANALSAVFAPHNIWRAD